MITIFTDGAARGNPGPGGWGAIIADKETANIFEVGGREDATTNNRMEIKAALEGLKNAPGDTVELFTDSAYLLNGATKWISGWQENNWQTKKKEDVLNRDLWEELAEAMQGKRIAWHRLSGHAGIPANERCDVIATSFADKKSIKLFSGKAEEYFVDLTLTEAGEKGKKNKSRSKAQAYSYVSAVNGKVETHATWAETERRVKGVSGARFKKSLSKEDEEEIIKEFSK